MTHCTITHSRIPTSHTVTLSHFSGGQRPRSSWAVTLGSRRLLTGTSGSGCSGGYFRLGGWLSGWLVGLGGFGGAESTSHQHLSKPNVLSRLWAVLPGVQDGMACTYLFPFPVCFHVAVCKAHVPQWLPSTQCAMLKTAPAACRMACAASPTTANIAPVMARMRWLDGRGFSILPLAAQFVVL